SPLTPPFVHLATRKSRVPGSSRALGWDTMLPTSSCGTQVSPAAFGHVGFTGTSLWIDPVLDRYFVLLTNRVCGGGTSEDMKTVRGGFRTWVGSRWGRLSRLLLQVDLPHSFLSSARILRRLRRGESARAREVTRSTTERRRRIATSALRP